MFEIFEPVIRQNCGKIFALAGIGVLTMMYFIFEILMKVFHYLVV